MNKEIFIELNQYLLDGKMTIKTYRMIVESLERIHNLIKEQKDLEQSIQDELIRMEQGEFNQYRQLNIH